MQTMVSGWAAAICWAMLNARLMCRARGWPVRTAGFASLTLPKKSQGMWQPAGFILLLICMAISLPEAARLPGIRNTLHMYETKGIVLIGFLDRQI